VHIDVITATHHHFNLFRTEQSERIAATYIEKSLSECPKLALDTLVQNEIDVKTNKFFEKKSVMKSSGRYLTLHPIDRLDFIRETSRHQIYITLSIFVGEMYFLAIRFQWHRLNFAKSIIIRDKVAAKGSLHIPLEIQQKLETLGQSL
jgi:hypothetical protein